MHPMSAATLFAHPNPIATEVQGWYRTTFVTATDPPGRYGSSCTEWQCIGTVFLPCMGSLKHARLLSLHGKTQSFSLN